HSSAGQAHQKTINTCPRLTTSPIHHHLTHHTSPRHRISARQRHREVAGRKLHRRCDTQHLHSSTRRHRDRQRAPASRIAPERPPRARVPPHGRTALPHGAENTDGPLPAHHPRRRRSPDRKSTRLNSSHVSISYAV